MDVLENIKNGVYENKMKYPEMTDFLQDKPTYADYSKNEINAAKEKLKRAKENYREESHQLISRFKGDLMMEFGMANFPYNEKAEKAWNIAWDEGHSSGLEQVYHWFDKLVDLIK